MNESRKKNSEYELDSELASVIAELEADRIQMDVRIDSIDSRMLEQKLLNAIQIGAEQGRRGNRGFRKERWSLQFIVAILCMLIMLTAFVRISPTFASIIEEIPGFGRFVKLVGYDRSLVEAINHEYIQLVDRSAEQNGYKLTINGVLADSQRMVLLYTAEGPDLKEVQNTFLKYKLKDGNGNGLSAMSSSSHFFRDATGKDGVVQDYLDIRMSPGQTIPQQLIVQMQLSGEWLEVEVPIDHSKFASLIKTMELNQTIEIADQRIIVKKAVITPLQVTIEFASDPTNSKRINEFIDLQLVDERGVSYKSITGFGKMDEGMMKHFQLSAFDQPMRLTLKANGVLLSDRGMKLVIDTEKKQIVSAPDENLHLATISRSDGDIEMTFELLQESPAGYMLFRYDGSFQDRSGREYSYEYRTMALRVSEEITGIYSYNIPDVDYAQPLTFDIYEYNGQFLQDITVKIK